MRDLLAEFDGVEGLVLRQAAQDGQLRAQHVTLGYGSNHFSRSGFELVHGREWQPVGRTDDHFVLRLMERGDFVAQVTITPWTKAEPGKHMAPEAFAEEMGHTPGWNMDRELQASDVRADEGRWIYRISALGTLDGAHVMKNFYLVAGPGGEQVVLVFTMTPKQADRLGSRESVPLLTAEQFRALKPLFVVRTPAQWERDFRVWAAVFFAAFLLVHLWWTIRGFTGDQFLLPVLLLLSGIGLILMISLRDPVRDNLLFVDFAQGAVVGALLLAV